MHFDTNKPNKEEGWRNIFSIDYMKHYFIQNVLQWLDLYSFRRVYLLYIVLNASNNVKNQRNTQL